jgi:hypothetical protein
MCALAKRFLSSLLFSCFVVSVALAQLPATRLTAVFPLGGNPGKTVEVTIFGADLDDVDRLLFSHAGITAKQKMDDPGPFDKTPQVAVNQFVISVAANVPIGSYEVRAVGKYGASNPRVFAVSDIPEAVEVEPNDDQENANELTLPVVINGQSNKIADVDYYHFTAPAGQRILVTSFARRVDSRIDSLVTVYDANGRTVGSSGADQGRDSLVDFTTRAAGEYFVKVHDTTYQGSSEHVYRLSIGVLPHIDFIFPPAGQAGGGRQFTIFGRNLPGGKPSGMMLRGRRLDSLVATINIPSGPAALALDFSSTISPASAGLDAIEYRVKGPQGLSQPTLIGIATAASVLEVADNGEPSKAQLLTMPCEVMGKFYPERDRDWFQIEVKKDESISIDVISHRLGLPTNVSLLVQRITPAEGEKPEKVQQLAFLYESANLDGGSEFDIRHHDASFQFTAPSDGVYRLMLRDAYADVSADPRRIYRLVVHNGVGDFRLAAIPEQSFSSVLLRKGGQVGIRVVAFRRNGFEGEIHVAASGLPAGVTCADAIIGPGSNVGMLVLTAATNAAPSTAMVKVIGKAKVGATDVTRLARFGAALMPTTNRTTPNQNMPTVDARLTRDLCVSVSANENALVSIQAGGGKTWETSCGGKLTIPVTREGTFKGQVNFMGRGLPGINFPVANVAANKTTGELQVNLNRAILPGTYTIYLDAIAQQVEYVRNPEAAAKAAERKKEVDQIKTKADADAKAAATAKTAADKLAAVTTATVTTTRSAKTAADKALSAAMATAKTTSDAAAKAAVAAAATPDNANLTAAATATKKTADDAAAKVVTASATAATADKTLVDAVSKAKEAAEAKTKTDATAVEAVKMAQLAAQLKTKTDQQATALTNAAKPKKLNVPVVSKPITIKIVPAPITVGELKPVTVKQGEKVEVSVAITRLFSYEGQVRFNTVLPAGVTGVSIPSATAPAKQSQAKLTITAAANATEGPHQLNIRGTLNINGQNLIVEQSLQLIVQKVTVTK